MVVELEVERWYSHPSRRIYIVGHFSLDTWLCEQHFRSVIFTSGYFCLGGGGGGSDAFFRYL